MPAKKKEEAKSATDIEIAAAYDAMMRGEAAVQNCREAIDDLALHTTRLKQLEAELGPCESEHRGVVERFYRVVEGGCAFRKQRGPAAHITAASVSLALQQVNASFNGHKPTTPRGRSTAGHALSSPAEPVADDKELNKLMGIASKDVLMGVLQPLFFLPRTPSELHNSAVLAAKIAEAISGAQPSDQMLSSSTAASSGRVSTPRKKMSAGAGLIVPLSQQPLRPEPALLPPIGVDFALHSEVLKLREQRLSAEKSIENLQEQIRQSREILQRRKDEGSGTKAALKKAEKELNVLIKAHSALTYKKEGEEILKRKEEAAAAIKKSEEKSVKKK